LILEFIRFLKGFVKIRVIGYSAERFINACKYRNIRLWGILSKNGCYEMYITIHGFKKIKIIVRKTGTKVAIIERFGLPFLLFKYRKRKVFLLCAFMCVIHIYVLSLYIWDIEIEGNLTRTEEVICDYLSEQNIKKGVLRKSIDCTEIVSGIRKKFDDVIWVSSYIDGSKLYVHIKENDSMKNSEEIEKDICTDIIANVDCRISKIITRKGVPFVKEGDEVKKGDLLVSGVVEVMNDNKEVIGYQGKNAQASILGLCKMDYDDSISSQYEEKEYEENDVKNYYIRIKDCLIKLGKNPSIDKERESIFYEKQMILGEDFGLPIWFGRKTTKYYVSTKKNYSEEDMEHLLNKKIEKTCKRLEKKGVEIIENSVKIYTECNYAQAKGTLEILCEVGEEVERTVPELPMEDITNGND